MVRKINNDHIKIFSLTVSRHTFVSEPVCPLETFVDDTVHDFLKFTPQIVYTVSKTARGYGAVPVLV